MKTAIAIIALALTGCAVTQDVNKPVQQVLVYDKEVQGMTRNEVLTAINECESNNARAVLSYAKRRITGVVSEIVVDVTCAPRFRFSDGTLVGRPSGN